MPAMPMRLAMKLGVSGARTPCQALVTEGFELVDHARLGGGRGDQHPPAAWRRVEEMDAAEAVAQAQAAPRTVS